MTINLLVGDSHTHPEVEVVGITLLEGVNTIKVHESASFLSVGPIPGVDNGVRAYFEKDRSDNDMTSEVMIAVYREGQPHQTDLCSMFVGSVTKPDGRPLFVYVLYEATEEDVLGYVQNLIEEG